MSEYREAAEFARDLVRKAGEVVASMQSSAVARDKGGSLGPVTDADFASEAILLAGIRRRYPDDAILSEESEQEVDVTAPRIWCVDPLDGTREYAKGLGEYAVMAGLLVDHEPVAGALAVPSAGSVYWGWRGGGAFRDGERLTLQEAAGLEQAIAIHSRSRKNGVREKLDLLGVTNSIEAAGCGFKVAQILEGHAHLYLHARAGITWWDSVAPAAVFLAAGGQVTDSSGAPLAYRDEINHRTGLIFAVPGIPTTPS